MSAASNLAKQRAVRKVKVDIYAICWNEEDMIEFFFENYDSIANRYVIFDDGSTDRTLELLSANPKVEIRRFDRVVEDSYVLSALALHDTAWKESRGTADWVLITAIDEHLKHPDLAGYLQRCKQSGVTLVPAVGFQMVSDHFPQSGENLAETVTHGAPFEKISKLCLFQPSEIEETRFSTGRHLADPTGNVVFPETDEVCNLHFKYLDLDRLRARHEILAAGLGTLDTKRGWGHRYKFDDSRLREDFYQFKQNAIDVHRLGAKAAEANQLPRWWRELESGYMTAAVDPIGSTGTSFGRGASKLRRAFESTASWPAHLLRQLNLRR